MTAPRTQAYRLDELAKLASEQGLEWRRGDDNHVDVTVATDSVPAFCNLVDENDTLVGVDGSLLGDRGAGCCCRARQISCIQLSQRGRFQVGLCVRC